LGGTNRETLPIATKLRLIRHVEHDDLAQPIREVERDEQTHARPVDDQELWQTVRPEPPVFCS
jgi:hypothetical protein